MQEKEEIGNRRFISSREQRLLPPMMMLRLRRHESSRNP